MTGPELQTLRRALGLSQSRMAEKVGCSRNAVSYWECKRGEIDTRWGFPARILEVLGRKSLPNFCTITRGRGDGVLGEWLTREYARIDLRAMKRAQKHRQQCGAKTRKGRPCKLLSEAGRRRCKFHGGLSTGPKTPAGKARIAKAQRRRWAVWRGV